MSLEMPQQEEQPEHSQGPKQGPIPTTAKFARDTLPAKTNHKSRAEQKELFEGDRERVIHGVFIWGVRIAALCIAAIFVVRVVHFLIPTKCFWLDADQIQALDRFLFSGVVGAFVGRYMQDVFGPSNGTK